jgi:hypothetical protein
MVPSAMTFVLLALILTVEDGGSPTQQSSAPATRPSLLRAARLQRSDGAPNAGLLQDGVASTDGDVWNSPRAVILSPAGVIEWDLGRTEIVAALRIQADNNDRYLVWGSLDGTRWYPIWVANAVELPGIQTRTSPELSAQARFLRLTAEGGDAMYSISELEVFDSATALAGAQLERIAPPPPPPPPPAPPFDTGFVVVFGVAGAIAYYFRQVMRLNQAKANPPPPDALKP